MAVSTTTSLIEYTLDGATTVYSVTFQFFAAADLVLSWGATGTETTLALGSDYTVAARPAELPATGSITLTSAGTNGEKLRIRRSTPKTQSVDLSTSGPIDPESIEDADDRAMLLIQEVAEGAALDSDFVHGNLGGGSLHAAATSATSGFYPAADKVLNDAHRANTSNPHSVTAAQAGAAPSSHVGSTDVVTGHPVATTLLPGFMSAADKSRLDSLTTTDFVNLIVRDHFSGPILNTSQWARTTAGTAPTASVEDTTAFGVYRELTAAAASSSVLRRTTTSVSTPTHNPVYKAGYRFGAQGSSYANLQVDFGFAEDPSTLTQNYALFRVGSTGTLTAVSRATGAEQVTTLSPLADFAFHKYQISLSTTQALFYFDGVLVATHTLQLPGASTPLEAFDLTQNSGGSAQQSNDCDYVIVTATVTY